MNEKYSIKECSKILKKYYDVENSLYEELDVARNNEISSSIPIIKSKLERIIEEKDSFIENIYALQVFEKYKKSKPKLVRLRTQEVVLWTDAFGEDFEKIPLPLRHSLVGLVEDDHGKYIFK